MTDSGIDVVEATDEMAMVVLGDTLDGIELMAVEDAKRRADAIEALIPISIVGHNKTKEELREAFKALRPVVKDGNLIQFYRSAFGKVFKGKGLIIKIIPQLSNILEQSVLAYSEADNLGGTMRPDGTVHKEHPNVVSFDNYVGKVEIDGREYYVRTTVKRQKEKRGHILSSCQMWNYMKNPPMVCRIRNLLRARGTTNGLLIQSYNIFLIMQMES